MPNEEMNEKKTEKTEKKKPDVKRFFTRVWGVFRHNIGWKILSLVLAICLWAGLISQDTTLTRSRVFTDATIAVQNAEALQRNGFVVVSGLDESTLNNVRLRVEVPQKNYTSVTAANYNPRVDLSKIKSAGEQTLTVQTTSTSSYGTVSDISVPQMTVQVEKYVMRSRIPVSLDMTGQAPEGFYAANAGSDPMYVAVAGPQSKVEKIVRCVARYDMSILEAKAGTQRYAVSFDLLDRQGNIVDREGISVTSGNVLIDSITVEQALYRNILIAVDPAALLRGTLPEGYEIKSIKAEPDSVTVALAFAESNTLTLTPTALADITGKTATCEFNVSLKRPADAMHMSTDQIYLLVQIGPTGE